MLRVPSEKAGDVLSLGTVNQRIWALARCYDDGKLRGGIAPLSIQRRYKRSSKRPEWRLLMPLPPIWLQEMIATKLTFGLFLRANLSCLETAWDRLAKPWSKEMRAHDATV
jgi:hypothetical protein